MRFYAHEKLALVVDGKNIWSTARALGLDMDWGKLQDFFARQATMVSCTYFTEMESSEEFNPIRPLKDWLEFHGWQVVTQTDDTAVDLAVACLEMAPWIDHFMLATGDVVFLPLIHALQRKGRRVSLLSSIKANGASCADEMRRQADAFVDLDELRLAVARPARAPKETVLA